MIRRDFLRWSMGGVLATGLMPGHARAWLPDFAAIDLQATGMNKRQWQVMLVVQAHLFPSEPHAPGARDVNAGPYLQWVLSDPALPASRRNFFHSGVNTLMAMSQQEYDKPFDKLPGEAREKLLRRFEGKEDGAHWLREVLNYILEATLTDPVYGGNPDRIGWKWLAYRPAYKRPPPEKRYFLLPSQGSG